MHEGLIQTGFHTRFCKFAQYHHNLHTITDGNSTQWLTGSTYSMTEHIISPDFFVVDIQVYDDDVGNVTINKISIQYTY